MERPSAQEEVPGPGIVIAAHDAAPWIAETLRSVLAQTITTWSCVIVDDGSRDGTADVVRSVIGGDPRFLLLSREQGGASAARNTGLAALPPSCGQVTFLDSDDLWLPDALLILTTALRDRSDAVGVSATAELIDETGTPISPGTHSARLRERLVARHGRLLRLAPGADTTFECLATAGRIWPPAVVMLDRRRVDAVHGFDENLRVSEDWDLFLRISRSGPLSFLDRQVAWYRRREGSLTSGATDRVVYYNDVVRHKACTSPDNTAPQHRAALRGWRTVQLHAALLNVRLGFRGLLHGRRSQVVEATRAATPLLLEAMRRGPREPRPVAGPRRTSLLTVVQPRSSRRQAAATT